MFNFYIPKQFSNYNQQSSKHYAIIIIGDLNVDILKNNNQAKINKNYYISRVTSN
jgi:hypothetical protein